MDPGASVLNARSFTIKSSGKTSNLRSLSAGWFFVRVLVTISSAQLDELRNDYHFEFKPSQFIQKGWFRMYIDENQMQYLQSHSDLFELFPAKQYNPTAASILKSGGGVFMVEAIPGWTPQPDAGKIQSRMTENLYNVETNDPQKLAQDPAVYKIDEKPQMRLF